MRTTAATPAAPVVAARTVSLGGESFQVLDDVSSRTWRVRTDDGDGYLYFFARPREVPTEGHGRVDLGLGTTPGHLTDFVTADYAVLQYKDGRQKHIEFVRRVTAAAADTVAVRVTAAPRRTTTYVTMPPDDELAAAIDAAARGDVSGAWTLNAGEIKAELLPLSADDFALVKGAVQRLVDVLNAALPRARRRHDDATIAATAQAALRAALASPWYANAKIDGIDQQLGVHIYSVVTVQAGAVSIAFHYATARRPVSVYALELQDNVVYLATQADIDPTSSEYYQDGEPYVIAHYAVPLQRAAATDGRLNRYWLNQPSGVDPDELTEIMRAYPRTVVRTWQGAHEDEWDPESGEYQWWSRDAAWTDDDGAGETWRYHVYDGYERYVGGTDVLADALAWARQWDGAVVDWDGNPVPSEQDQAGRRGAADIRCQICGGALFLNGPRWQHIAGPARLRSLRESWHAGHVLDEDHEPEPNRSIEAPTLLEPADDGPWIHEVVLWKAGDVLTWTGTRSYDDDRRRIVPGTYRVEHGQLDHPEAILVGARGHRRRLSWERLDDFVAEGYANHGQPGADAAEAGFLTLDELEGGGGPRQADGTRVVATSARKYRLRIPLSNLYVLNRWGHPLDPQRFQYQVDHVDESPPIKVRVGTSYEQNNSDYVHSTDPQTLEDVPPHVPVLDPAHPLYFLEDGHHRVRARQDRGETHVDAVVSVPDAPWWLKGDARDQYVREQQDALEKLRQLRHAPTARVVAALEPEDMPPEVNPDGTVTVYHATTADAAQRILHERMLRSQAEPDVFCSSHPAGIAQEYGDGTVIAFDVDPRQLVLDDEFQDGRKDYSIPARRRVVPIRNPRIVRRAATRVVAAPRQRTSCPKCKQPLARPGQYACEYCGQVVHPTKDLGEAAVRQFGEATGPAGGGFLLADGRFVEVGAGEDHRAINYVVPAALRDESQTRTMWNWMQATGGIRYRTQQDGRFWLDVRTPITGAQVTALRAALRSLQPTSFTYEVHTVDSDGQPYEMSGEGADEFFGLVVPNIRRGGRSAHAVAVVLGGHVVQCSVADTHARQARGLQGQAALADGQGMLFTWPDVAPRTFHMGTVTFPIDIVFVAKGRVGRVVTGLPGVTDRWTAPADMVVEVPAGWCAARGVGVGAQASGPRTLVTQGAGPDGTRATQQTPQDAAEGGREHTATTAAPVQATRVVAWPPPDVGDLDAYPDYGWAPDRYTRDHDTPGRFRDHDPLADPNAQAPDDAWTRPTFAPVDRPEEFDGAPPVGPAGTSVFPLVGARTAGDIVPFPTSARPPAPLAPAPQPLRAGWHVADGQLVFGDPAGTASPTGYGTLASDYTRWAQQALSDYARVYWALKQHGYVANGALVLETEDDAGNDTTAALYPPTAETMLGFIERAGALQDAIGGYRALATTVQEFETLLKLFEQARTEEQWPAGFAPPANALLWTFAPYTFRVIEQKWHTVGDDSEPVADDTIDEMSFEADDPIVPWLSRLRRNYGVFREAVNPGELATEGRVDGDIEEDDDGHYQYDEVHYRLEVFSGGQPVEGPALDAIAAVAGGADATAFHVTVNWAYQLGFAAAGRGAFPKPPAGLDPRAVEYYRKGFADGRAHRQGAAGLQFDDAAVDPRDDSYRKFRALQAGEEVGFITYTLEFRYRRDDWSVHIEMLHVRPEHRGRGVGQKLLLAFRTHVRRTWRFVKQITGEPTSIGAFDVVDRAYGDPIYVSNGVQLFETPEERAEAKRTYLPARSPEDASGRIVTEQALDVAWPMRRKRGGAPLAARVQALAPALAAAAQAEVDVWQPDDVDGDPEVGFGGICDRVAQALAGVLAEAGIDTTDGGQDGDDHAWVIAYDSATREAVGVDIPPNVYEHGSGYNWTKIPGAQVTAADVQVWPLPYDDVAGGLEFDAAVRTAGAEFDVPVALLTLRAKATNPIYADVVRDYRARIKRGEALAPIEVRGRIAGARTKLVTGQQATPGTRIYEVNDGHHRALAAAAEGVTTLRAYRVDELSPEEVQQYGNPWGLPVSDDPTPWHEREAARVRDWSTVKAVSTVFRLLRHHRPDYVLPDHADRDGVVAAIDALLATDFDARPQGRGRVLARPTREQVEDFRRAVLNVDAFDWRYLLEGRTRQQVQRERSRTAAGPAVYDPAAYAAALLDGGAASGWAGLDWRPDMLNGRATEHARIDADVLSAWAAALPASDDDQAALVDVAVSPGGLATLADAVVVAGVADTARVRGKGLVLFRGIGRRDT